MEGVTYKYMLHFIETYKGMPGFDSFTANGICEHIVKPMTDASTKQSFTDYLLANDATQDFVGDATWFISHAWKYHFIDVVEAIGIFLRKEYGDQAGYIVVWFDLFSICQHRSAELELEN